MISICLRHVSIELHDQDQQYLLRPSTIDSSIPGAWFLEAPERVLLYMITVLFLSWDLEPGF